MLNPSTADEWTNDPTVERCERRARSMRFGESEGDSVKIGTEQDPVRFIFVAGKPLGEPVAWGGPIVMNTREELRVAFDEYEKGTFIKH